MMRKPAPNQATRGAILDRLKRLGALPAAALGAALGVTPMAVRLHLYTLEEEGLVAEIAAPMEGNKRRAPKPRAPKPRGRPEKLWALTDDAAKIFPDAHQGLAVDLIGSVENLFGKAGLAKLIAAHGDRQRKIYKDNLKGAKTLAERVKRLAKARDGEGYMAEARRDGGDWLLIENHCPICSAAKACTKLCANELEVFRDVLGKDVTVEREEHILSGARRCAYRVGKG